MMLETGLLQLSEMTYYDGVLFDDGNVVLEHNT